MVWLKKALHVSSRRAFLKSQNFQNEQAGPGNKMPPDAVSTVYATLKLLIGAMTNRAHMSFWSLSQTALVDLC